MRETEEIENPCQADRQKKPFGDGNRDSRTRCPEARNEDQVEAHADGKPDAQGEHESTPSSRGHQKVRRERVREDRQEAETENRHRNGGEPEVLAEQNRDDRLTGQHEHASENPAGAREKKEKEP